MLLSIVTMILMLNQAAREALQAGDWSSASTTWRQALTLSEQSCGPDDPVTAMLLRNLAGVYRREQLYRKSEILAQRSLHILESRFGGDDPSLVPSLNTLAEVYFEEHRYTESERLLKRAGKLGERNPGAHYATTLHDLGAVYQVLGRPADAMPLYARAIEIRDRLYGPGNAYDAATLENLSRIPVRVVKASRRSRR